MFVAAARLSLDVAALGAVRAKKQLVRRVTDRVKARFTLAISELPDEGEAHAQLGLAVLGVTAKQAKEQLERVLRFVDEMSVAPVASSEIDVLRFGDGAYEADGASSVELAIPKGERTLAEAEGLGDWEQRPQGPLPSSPRAPHASSPRPSAPALSLEEARARARALRKPRDWEQPPVRRSNKDG